MGSTWADSDLTADGFLGGRLVIRQPARGYRAGLDPVLLAAAVTAQAGDRALDLGCGAGTAGLCLAVRVPGVAVMGVELDAGFADLARRNAADNGLSLDVVCADIAALPADLRARDFDHVLMNPPYFDRAKGSAAPDPTRERALGGATPVAVWIDAATRRLRPGGWLTLIQRMARLPEVLAAVDDRLGSGQLRPVIGRPAQPADLFLLRLRKGGRAPFAMLPALVLHDGPRHPGDGIDDRSALATAILRDGAALDWPG